MHLQNLGATRRLYCRAREPNMSATRTGALAYMLVVAALACLFTCRDPNSYKPFDPTKPDPPALPALISPADGWMSEDYAYRRT